MPEILSEMNTSSKIIMTVAIMLLAGFLLTRLTKLLRLPNVTGYILAGIIIGPYALNVVSFEVAGGMDFIADIALAFIAFSTGEFFKFSTLKESGLKNVLITVFESLTASVLVFVVTYFLLNLGIVFSIVLSALASATAPASTLITIKQTKAKGDFVNTLLQVVALDDVIGLICFSVAISVALSEINGNASFSVVVLPVIYNVLALIGGGICGVILKFLLPTRRSIDNRLIVSVAVLFGFCGLCTVMDVSPLLGCMAMGTVYINLSKDEKLFKQLNYFSPPILLLFFVRSGVCFNLGSLFNAGDNIAGKPLVIIGVIYFFIRIAGKYLGALIGCLVCRKDKKVAYNLGLALIPQAGVAIGLSTLAQRTIGGFIGESLSTVILASSILYELIGPASAKLALFLSKSFGKETDGQQAEERKEEQNLDVKIIEQTISQGNYSQSLVEKVREIVKNLPKTTTDENEQAFNEGAEESLYYKYNRQKRRKGV